MSFKSGRKPVMSISHYFSRYFYGVTRDVKKAKVRCKWAVFDFSPWCSSDRVQHRPTCNGGYRCLSQILRETALFLKTVKGMFSLVQWWICYYTKHESTCYASWLNLLNFFVVHVTMCRENGCVFYLLELLRKVQRKLTNTTDVDEQRLLVLLWSTISSGFFHKLVIMRSLMSCVEHSGKEQT